MIGVKILVSCCLFLIAMQDSLRYCFADDTDSWFFFDKPMNLEVSKSGEGFNLSGPFNRELFGILSTLEFS